MIVTPRVAAQNLLFDAGHRMGQTSALRLGKVVRRIGDTHSQNQNLLNYQMNKKKKELERIPIQKAPPPEQQEYLLHLSPWVYPNDASKRPEEV